MAKRKIIWTRTADIQFLGILNYWTQKNQSNTYALKLIKLTTGRINLIAKAPLLYRETDIQGLRVSVLGSFSIFYRFTNDDLYIVAFWDNRQDPEQLLNLFKKK